MKKLDNSECLVDFGRFILAERNRKGLNQTEVAHQVGIHQTYYSKIENGDREVDLITAMNICRALDLDLSDFIKTKM